MDSSAAARFRKAHPIFGAFLQDHEIIDVGDESGLGKIVKALAARTPEHTAVLGEALLKTLAKALPALPTVPQQIMANDPDASQGMRVGSMVMRDNIPVQILSIDPDAQVFSVRFPDGHVGKYPGTEFTSTHAAGHMAPKAHGSTLHKSASRNVKLKRASGFVPAGTTVTLKSSHEGQAAIEYNLGDGRHGLAIVANSDLEL